MNQTSLYVPCFNGVKTIGLCLEAVLKQTYRIKEIVVVDDGSTDGSIDIVLRYPVRLIRHTDNRGLASARNTAIKSMEAEFIASLDADCRPQPQWLELLMNKFISGEVAGAGGKLMEANSSSVLDSWRCVHMKQYWEDERTYPPFLFGSNTVFRKEALVDVGLYNEDYRSNYEDVDICCRLVKSGHKLVYEPQAVVMHLKSDDICSLLDNYWKWNFDYFQNQGVYSNPEQFGLKLKANSGLSVRYMEEDVSAGRAHLVYLDFLLAFHHFLRDVGYFMLLDNKSKTDRTDNSNLAFSHWLALLDLTFFFHFDYSKDSLATFIPRRNALSQNLLLLNLVLAKFVQERFDDDNFLRILYKHLFLSVNRMDNDFLLDELLTMVSLRKNWDILLTKKQPNLNTAFLEIAFSTFRDRFDGLRGRIPDIIGMINSSAEKTEEFCAA